MTVLVQGSCSLRVVLYPFTASCHSVPHTKELSFASGSSGTQLRHQQCSWRLLRGRDRRFPSITALLDSPFSLFQSLQIWFTSSKAAVKSSDGFRTSAFQPFTAGWISEDTGSALWSWYPRLAVFCVAEHGHELTQACHNLAARY